MPKSERTRSVSIELDRIVVLGQLEEAALPSPGKRRPSWWPTPSSP